MSEHKYILEPYKGINTRYRCPGCMQRDKTFSLYIDTVTGELINKNVGRCNREVNCGYHYPPKEYFEDNGHLIEAIQQKQFAKPKQTPPHRPKPISLIPFKPFEKSLQHYGGNNFVKYLARLFSAEIKNGLIEKYFIGTSKHWNGATVFWQIDISGKLRSGKIMLYNSDTGKRVKEKINWVHSILKIEGFTLQQCFFGEHLLRGNTKPVAIFESEKTAIIASVYFPDFICIACGGLAGLSVEKCKVLQGRNVILYPDLSKLGALKNCFGQWSNSTKELFQLYPRTRFNISDLLERKATDTDREQGLDLADYLLKFDYNEFTLTGQGPTKEETFIALVETHTGKKFDDMILAYVKTVTNKEFDLLFDPECNAIVEQNEKVKSLADFYNKNFVEILLNGDRYLAHVIT